jgi:hypothetical protein
MAVTEPFTRSGIVPHKERSDRHEKELNARIAVAIQSPSRSSEQPHRAAEAFTITMANMSFSLRSI